MSARIYIVPRVLTWYHNENTEQFHHQKPMLTSNSPNTAHVCWPHSLAFSRMSYKWNLTARSLSELTLSFSISAAAQMVVVSQRAVFQVRVATVGPVVHLMDDVRIVFLKTIFLIFLKIPHAATKTRCNEIKKKKHNSILRFQLKKKILWQGNTKIWYHLRMEKSKKYILNFNTLSCCRFTNAKAI